MRKILEACPTCNSELTATELSCTACETVVRGRYAPCRFCRLPAEDLAFLELFVQTRGNVKEMERELGISYWTIRSRLDEVVAALGFEEQAPARPAEAGSERRREILQQLERGDITVAEAAERLARSAP